MKRIFSFLLTIGLVFWISEGWGQDVTMPAGSKVRYGIELKQLTKQEAQDAVARGYVDLWVYAWFNQKFVDQGYIVLNGEEISRINIRLAANTQGFQIVYKDGTNDLRADNNVSNCVAAFPGKAQQDAIVYDDDEESAVGSMGIRDCFGSCTGGSLDGPATNLTGSAAKLLSKIEMFEGEKWYGRALYKLRIKYNKAESFYVEHRFDDKPSNSCGLATSNFNIRPGATNNIFAPYPSGCNGNADWSITHTSNPAGTSCMKISGAFGTIRGGVEVISDPEMLLTAEATCGGTDATGKLTVNDWAGKTWADYSGVKFFVNTTGGTVRKPLTASDIATTPSPIPTTGTAAEIAYTLTPEGYTMPDGSYADSLIWVIEDTFLA